MSDHKGMSDHKFEASVRKKMEELKITPSAAAWKGIETSLYSKRRRRLSVWIPLLLLLITGSAGYFFLGSRELPSSQSVKPGYTENPSTPKNSQVGKNGQAARPESADSLNNLAYSSQPQINTAEPSNQPPVLANGVSKIDVTANSGIKIIPGNRHGKVVHSAPLATISTTRKDRLTYRNKKGNNTSGFHSDQSAQYTYAGSNDKNKNSGKPVSSTTSSASQEPKILTGDIAKQNVNRLKQTQIPMLNDAGANDSASIVTNVNDKIVDKVNNKDNRAEVLIAVPAPDKKALAKNTSAAKKKNKQKTWQWGISASAGTSLINDGGALNFSNAAVQDLSLSAPVANAPVVNAGFYKPSELKPGLHFSAGVTIKKNISKRISLSTGLTYSQFNIVSQVGKRMDRAQIVSAGRLGYYNVSSYYLNSRYDDYNNKYQFLELPLTFHLQLNKSATLPLYWNAGASVGRLLSSNNLHFDGTTGYYYRNNDLLNKVQAGVATSFSFVLFNKKSIPIWIGPGVRYNLSPLLKKGVSVNEHLIAPGIDVKVFFKK